MIRRMFAICAVLLSATSIKPLAAAQMLGAQVESQQRTGYGMYVVRMKPSSHPGTISSFFLFHSDRLWPKGWAEIDIEFTPGYRTRGDTARRFVLDQENGDSATSCYDPLGSYDSNFFKAHCDVRSTESGTVDIARYRNEDGALVNRSLSFNTFGNSPLVLNQSATSKPPVVELPGDRQVFYNPPGTIDPYADFYNYYIWYTPTGLYWSGAIPDAEFSFPESNTIPEGAAFPDPVFAKLWNPQLPAGPNPRFAVPGGISFRNNAQMDALAYGADQFTPLDGLANTVLDSGRQLFMTFNIWDGSQTVPSLSPQPWGGPQPPSNPTAAIYQKVAYFPLKSLKDDAKQKRYPGPKDYSYDATTNYSDFTVPEGRFILNGKKASFDQLWLASDGAADPLGVLSGYSVFCYPKKGLKDGAGAAPKSAGNGLYLQLRRAGDYAIPTGGQQIDRSNNVTNCAWADTRGTR